MDTVVWILIIVIVLGVFGYFMYRYFFKESGPYVNGDLNNYQNTQERNRNLASRWRKYKSLSSGIESFNKRQTRHGKPKDNTIPKIPFPKYHSQ